MWKLKPSSHIISKITKMVQSMEILSSPASEPGENESRGREEVRPSGPFCTRKQLEYSETPRKPRSSLYGKRLPSSRWGWNLPPPEVPQWPRRCRKGESSVCRRRDPWRECTRRSGTAICRASAHSRSHAESIRIRTTVPRRAGKLLSRGPGSRFAQHPGQYSAVRHEHALRWPPRLCELHPRRAAQRSGDLAAAGSDRGRDSRDRGTRGPGHRRLQAAEGCRLPDRTR